MGSAAIAKWALAVLKPVTSPTKYFRTRQFYRLLTKIKMEQSYQSPTSTVENGNELSLKKFLYGSWHDT